MACNCTERTAHYIDCGHIIKTTISTGALPLRCEHASECGSYLRESCPDCSKSPHASESSADGKVTQTPEQLIQSQIKKAEENMRDQFLFANPRSEQGAKKAKANKELKKFIAALALTREIENIFAEAEGKATRAHEKRWDFQANHILLEMKAAVKAGNAEKVSNLEFSFYDRGLSLKEELRAGLQEAKEAVLKQCEEGVERMLEALEKSSSGGL